MPIRLLDRLLSSAIPFTLYFVRPATPDLLLVRLNSVQRWRPLGRGACPTAVPAVDGRLALTKFKRHGLFDAGAHESCFCCSGGFDDIEKENE
jgi:hypothetical protein